MMEKTIIAAVADNLAIGRDNSLLWHLSEDLKFFKRTTSGYPVIMGRRTFESIGRPLPHRLNIVVSHDFRAEGTVTAGSLKEAFSIAGKYFSEQGMSDGKCFIIGGGQIYRDAMEYADTLLITHVKATIDEADTFFPEIDSRIWEMTECSETFTDAESGYSYEFMTYRRRQR